MDSMAPKNQTFSDFDIKFNKTSVDELFKKYEEIGFIYPAKKAILKPHFKLISENWKKLVGSKEDLLWILTNQQKNEAKFASVSVWKQSNYGLIAQHLVSDGNPFLSLKVMLAAQFRAEHHYNKNEVKSSQNWFRPDNRYAFRVFASMFEKLGSANASLIPFHYLHVDVDQISKSSQQELMVEEVTDIDPELIGFVNQQCGEVFTRAEELDQNDIQLHRMNSAFSQYGLKRSRKILKIKKGRAQKTVACVVANRAPLGLNFSFLENRAYYILDKDLATKERAPIVKAMNSAIKSYYSDFELQVIPIVTDAQTSKVLVSQNAIFVREYMQSIWMREGFSMWFNHIQSFLQKIESRLERKKAA